MLSLQKLNTYKFVAPIFPSFFAITKFDRCKKNTCKQTYYTVYEPRCSAVTNTFTEFVKTYLLHPCPTEVTWTFWHWDMKVGWILFGYTSHIVFVTWPILYTFKYCMIHERCNTLKEIWSVKLWKKYFLIFFLTLKTQSDPLIDEATIYVGTPDLKKLVLVWIVEFQHIQHTTHSLEFLIRQLIDYWMSGFDLGILLLTVNEFVQSTLVVRFYNKYTLFF